MTRLDTQRFNSVFLVSTGRTGTTAIARYLNDCFEDVTALHEPKPSRVLRMASTARLTGRKTPEQLVEDLTKARRRICSETTTTFYVEANPYLYGFVDLLPEVFHNARVIHLVRDPRTMVRSALNFNVQRGIKWLFSELVPNWIIKPELIERNPQKHWAQMGPVERMAWYWATVNSHLEKQIESYPNETLRYRYEDLFQEDGSGIREIAGWIGLQEKSGLLDKMLKIRVNASLGKAMDPWENWPEEDRTIVYSHCGELMEKYGYKQES